jgi:hypothetical protein
VVDHDEARELVLDPEVFDRGPDHLGHRDGEGPKA